MPAVAGRTDKVVAELGDIGDRIHPARDKAADLAHGVRSAVHDLVGTERADQVSPGAAMVVTRRPAWWASWARYPPTEPAAPVTRRVAPAGSWRTSSALA